MQAFDDHYRTLQVHHEASQEVIEAAWKRLCRIYHPDVNHSARAGERMKEINAAYDVLCDARLRTAYHREWAGRAAKGFAAPPRPQAAARPAHDAAELAQQAIDGYFHFLMESRWEDAYGKLTVADRRNVPLEDFREWKNTVASSWRIGSYAIKPFRKHYNCTILGSFYREVYEFSVFVSDMDCRTGHVSEENYLKYVVLDGGSWRVCLGYTDVKPLILRFKYMAEDAALLDPAQVWAEAVLSRDRHTGLLSRAGFSEKAEAEAIRSRRYGNLFSVALFIIRPGEESGGFTPQEYARMCIVHAAKIFGSCIRQTDIFGRWSPSELAVLFTETARENAGFAVEKLMDRLGQANDLDYDVAAGIAEFDGMLFEDTMAAAASDAQVRRFTSDGIVNTFITMNDSM